jgi:holin-like protein
MNIDKAVGLCRRTVRQYHLLQMVLIVAIWKAGDILVCLTAAPLPGSIVGMLLLLFFLHRGLLDLSSIKRGTDWFLAEMLLFFVPAVLVVLDHREFLGRTGLKILAVILCGTVAVMICTALTIEMYFRWLSRSGDGRHVHG